MCRICTSETAYANNNISQVDAAIVRIMKTRKVLSHTLLITELFQQVILFVPFPFFSRSDGLRCLFKRTSSLQSCERLNMNNICLQYYHQLEQLLDARTPTYMHTCFYPFCD